MYSYTDLDVYKVSMDLVTEIYAGTSSFPKEEIYGLAYQLRRCAVSIPSNIAEGAGRNSTKEFVHFLSISNGSLSEMETQLEIAHRLGFLTDKDKYLSYIKRIRVMLCSLLRSLTPKTGKRNIDEN
jgi:four helix bundle protein